MTGMFRSQHLTKVLDKVVAGSPRVLVFLALALVEHNRLKIRESENAYEAVGKMTAAAATASEDTESRIISIALERLVYNHSMFLSKQIRLETHPVQTRPACSDDFSDNCNFGSPK